MIPVEEHTSDVWHEGPRFGAKIDFTVRCWKTVSMKLDDRLAKIGPRAATSVLSGTKKGSKSFSIEVTSPINDAGRAISASSSMPEHAAKAPMRTL